MITQTFLSIVIPAYNEEDNFQRGTLSAVVDYLSTQKYSWELILVNDGSSDNTSKLMHNFSKGRPSVKVIDNVHKGKAASIIAGATASRGKYIVFTDMDQATPISEISKLLDAFTLGFDIVIGSRSNRQGAPLYRKVLAYGMVVVRTIILRLPYRDTQCGFKGFTSASASELFGLISKVHPFHEVNGAAVNPGFDVELLYLGRKLGYKICEVPVIWHHQNTRRVRFIKDAVAGISELLLVRWRSITNLYGLK
jgi:dolichyl-phosphate beta-glucosyltransferase